MNADGVPPRGLRVRLLRARTAGDCAFRLAARDAEQGATGVWKPCVYDLGDREYKPTWLEHPDLGSKVDVIALPIYVDDEAFDPPPVPMTPFPAQLRIATKVFVVGFPIGFDPFTASGAIGLPSPADEKEASDIADGGYFCPYCGVPAQADAWFTKAQLELAEHIVQVEVVDPMLRKFTGGTSSRTQAPEPLTEDDDMRRTDFACHPAEPLKNP